MKATRLCLIIVALATGCATAPAPRSAHLGLVPFDSVFMLADPAARIPESVPDGDYRVDARVCASTSGATTAVVFLAPARADLRAAILEATSRWRHRPYMRDDERPALFCYDASFRFLIRDGQQESHAVTAEN